MKTLKGLASRRLALDALIRIDKHGIFSTTALADAFTHTHLSQRDRAFVTALVLGVTRQKLSLDVTINHLSSKPKDKLPCPLLNVLRLGLFQLDSMSDIPPSAVTNTCAELARIVGHKGQVSFTNGLLRSYLRNKIKLGKTSARTLDNLVDNSANRAESTDLSNIDNLPNAQALSITYSMPTWLVTRWLANFGAKETIKLLALAQGQQELCLRTCTQSITVKGLKSLLESHKIKVKQSSLVPNCLIVQSRSHKSDHSIFKDISGNEEGLFTVQDESSAFVAIVVDPKPKEIIIDLCAAPGGKTTHLSELMGNSGQIFAVDRNKARLKLVKENYKRLGLTNIQLIHADGCNLTLEQKADRILLDAPCTGTGVISKRPDLRYHRMSQDLDKLVRLQRQLLTNAASLIKSGGVLVYSTCSLEPEENVENMRWFLQNHEEFQSSDLTKYIPQKLLKEWSAIEKSELGMQVVEEQARQGYIQLLPSRHGVSGFFICRMVKL